MIQIIPRHKSFGEKLASGIGEGSSQAIQSFAQNMQNRNQDKAQAESMGDPEINKMVEAGVPFEKAFAVSMAKKQNEINKTTFEEERLAQKRNSQIEKARHEMLGFGEEEEVTASPGPIQGVNSQGKIEEDGEYGQYLRGEKQYAKDKGGILESEDINKRYKQFIENRKIKKTVSAQDKAEMAKRKYPELAAQVTGISSGRNPEGIKQLAKDQAKNDSEYWNKTQESQRSDIFKGDTVSKLKALNKKGVTASAWDRGLESLGLTQYTSEGRREFSALVKNLMTDVKSILGSQFSQKEFEFILNSHPSADFSQEANNAIIKNLEYAQDIRNEEYKIASRIKKESGGQIPPNFQELVNDHLQSYASGKFIQMQENNRLIENEKMGVPKGKVLMYDDKGEPFYASPEQVDQYTSAGATQR